MKRRFSSIGVALAAAVLIAAGAVAGALAASGGPTTVAAGSIDHVKVVRGGGSPFEHNTGRTTWANVTGASTAVKIPQGQHGLVIARFNGEADCYKNDQNPTGYCEGRILIGGVQASPGAVRLEHVVSGETTFWQGIAMERSRGPLGPGTYRVQVQVKVTSHLLGFDIGSWHLTVETARIG